MLIHLLQLDTMNVFKILMTDISHLIKGSTKNSIVIVTSLCISNMC